MDTRTAPFTQTGLMDFRAYLQELERQQQIVRIDDEIDGQEEAGAIMRWANENLAPAQWFTRIRGSMPGSSLIGGLYSTKERLAIAFGLPADISYREFTDFYASAMTRRLEPVVVEQGSCQDNVLLGDDIDLFRLPVPKLHPQDGNPYIGTLNIGVCRDYDSDWVNWGTYRGMVHDRKSTGLWLGPLNQGGQILRRYRENDRVMEYAMFFGGDPMHNVVASSGIPPGVSEVEMVGGVRGEPVRLVKCRTVDLHVPENAEIVLEGTVSPGDEKLEGPFGEYPGYVVSGQNQRPVFRLSALTYRNDPILPATCLGVPVDESVMWIIEVAASVKEALRAKGVPIADVSVPLFSGCHAVVVSTRTPVAGIPQMIGNIVWSDRNASYFPYLIVVNDDIDPWNLGEVFHAMCTKCNPVKDIHVYPGAINSPLTPYISNEPLREKGAGGGNVLFDCTWPIDWPAEKIPHRLAFSATYSEAVRRKVLDNIARWGLDRKVSGT